MKAATANRCILIACLLTSCSQAPSPLPTAEQVFTAADKQKLLGHIKKLKSDVLSLQFRLNQLESRVADVSTEETGYGIANTRFGVFTVSVKSVTPYLDGFKVKLTFGNTTSATFNGAKISVAWGQPYDENNPDPFANEQKSKDFDVSTSFQAGAFTDVDVALTPAKPEALRTLSVSLELN